MDTPKPDETSESYTVKFSNKTGGAYAEMRAVIESERKNWQPKGDQAAACKNANTNGNDPKQLKK